MPHKDPTKRKEYHKAYHKKWYENNKLARVKQIKAREKDIKNFVKSLRVKCVECGETHIACLDFHHKNPSEKEINLAIVHLQGWGKDRILKEVAKCIVLCSNCHRKLHYSNLG